MPNPLRMYCDMETGSNFVYIGEIKKNLVKYDQLDDLKVFRNECANLGLFPIEIK